MIKTAINNFLIWLNTPREIDIPCLSDSPDAQLYDDLYRQKERLESRKRRLLNMSAEHIKEEVFKKTGLILTEQQAMHMAMKDFCMAKSCGFVNELNELTKPKENF